SAIRKYQTVYIHMLPLSASSSRSYPLCHRLFPCDHSRQSLEDGIPRQSLGTRGGGTSQARMLSFRGSAWERG
ncbi:MAG: hypothetical protein KKD44_19295, partial [Proteobacteria bacterium]|nr:hypothetical protein [Pseudomonadota bacterium]